MFNKVNIIGLNFFQLGKYEKKIKKKISYINWESLYLSKSNWVRAQWI